MSDEPEKKEEAGVPAWVMTFADLMTLLMCFFVLLLSFAEMDILKFKQVAGSMKEAFGVQKVIPSDRSESTKDFLDGQTSDAPLFEKIGDLDSLDPKALAKLLEEMQAEQTEAEALKLAALLSEEIAAGSVELESTSDSIIIRINEKASFPSGRATLRAGFVEVLDKIHSALAEVEGTVTVAGHTDNRPINTKRFRSNWELSAGRAVSVVHALLRAGLLDSQRFLIEGHGDSHPLVANDTAENRARNRRVELIIVLKPADIESASEEVETTSAEESAESSSDAVEPTEAETPLAEPSADSAKDADSVTPLPESDAGQEKLVLPQKKPSRKNNGSALGAPAGLEREFPGANKQLPDFDGELDTPEELELLLRALDTAGDLPLDNE
ncbi:MAG: type VI secretion system protein TssL, long form [Gammaproteobacteria bacterium]|nr:type VI secretion system protein TssL, long form [Gammaproteobacteria bacterium]